MLTPKAPSWMSEFRKFIMRGNVVDLAVGVVIGVHAWDPWRKKAVGTAPVFVSCGPSANELN